MIRSRFIIISLLLILFAAISFCIGELLLSDYLPSSSIVQEFIPASLYIDLKTPFARLWPERRLSFPEVETIKEPVIPRNMSAEAFIPLEEQEFERGKQEAQEYQGVAKWFRVRWDEHTSIPRLYWGYEQQSFEAIVDVVSYSGNKEGWFLICLLDYTQIPCDTGDEAYKYIPDNGYTSFTLRTPPLSVGLHSINLILLADYGKERVERWVIEADVMDNPPYLVAVNGYAGKPHIQYITPPQTRGAFGIHLRLVDLHMDSYPLVVSDSFSESLSFHTMENWISVNQGDKIDLYLHLNNPLSEGIDYAVVAILDRRRAIPLYVDGESCSPLYVHNKSRSWQTLEVSLLAPTEPGHHNIQILSFAFPYISLEAAMAVNLDIGIGIAQPGTLIDLDIINESAEITQTGNLKVTISE